MAYLGVFGPHAIGKTTALLQLHGELQHTGLPVAIVLADNNRVLSWIHGEHHEVRHKGRTMWKGKAVEKAWLVDECVADDTLIWIVETVRMDTYRAIAEASQRYGGGAEAFLVVTSPIAFKRLMQDRCKNVGKTYNTEYWTKVKLVYESRGRYLNQARKSFKPNNIPYNVYTVGYERQEWGIILEHLHKMADRPLVAWYGRVNDKANQHQRQQRVRQDDHSEAVDESVHGEPTRTPVV